MIDFHSHILPGMDDGSVTPQESVKILRESARQGITHMAATSHYYPTREDPESFLIRRDEAWKLLAPYIKSGHFPQIKLGAEVQYFEGISQAYEMKDLRLEGTDILLIEMPFQNWTQRMVSDVLTVNAWPKTRVMIAHVDRYLRFAPPEALQVLKRESVLIQANADSFCQKFVRRKLLGLLEAGFIDVLGSDTHNSTSRPQKLEKAAQYIVKKLGDEAIERIDSLAEGLFSGDWAI